MGGFGTRGYTPTTREPARESGLSSVAGLARPLLAIAVVGVVVFIGYKLLKNASAAADASANDAQLAQMGQRMGDLERRLDQLEKGHKAFLVPSRPAAPSSPIATAVKAESPKHQLTFSRPVSAQAASPSPANSSPASNATAQNYLNSERANAASGQQEWEATADRLGNVVGELDSQRNALDSQREAIERDQARLDELAGRFERDSQPFRLERSSTPEQVGPVGLRLMGTDPKNQRYTMRLSVEGTTVELKDRALHEAIQFYASGGKLSFEIVVSRIDRDIVTGRLVLPQTIATR